MFKKIVSMIMICAMLIPLSPAVAADTTSVQPTIEEILNGYHAKAFETQIAQDTATASTYSRQADGSSKTLEQETVDELTAAGYEAYSVTNENYNELEDSLKTDFSDLGLDPDGSYIVVFSGEDPASPANSTRGSDITLPPHTENEGASSYFYYVHDNNIQYKMRYLTITSADAEERITNGAYVIHPEYWDYKSYTIVKTALVTMVDGVIKVPLATFVDLLGSLYNDPNHFTSSSDLLTLHATTTWTCNIIQIWNENENIWDTAQSSEYALSKAFIAGYVIDPMTENSTQYIGPESTRIDYSSNYDNLSQRKAAAAEAYEDFTIALDCVDSVSFYFIDEDNGDTRDYLFKNNRSSQFLFPTSSES